MNKLPELSFDAIIIGAGGAGMRAALQLAEANQKVAVISKVFPTRSHTVSAQGGIAASLGNLEEDRWTWHMFDTVNGSDFLGDQNAIEYMCREAPQAIYELEHMGLPFSRIESGRIYQRYFGGHTSHNGGDSVHRACAAADRTGHALLHALYQANLKANTTFYSEWFAVDLVKADDGAIAGVIAMDMATGELVFFKARATVLATGGSGRIYQSTTNAYINTGDGIGMALRAGLPVQDMEFWQFHPTGIAGAGCLVTEGCRGEGGYLLNNQGERYMERYSPHLKDLACRDIVSRASTMEILAGNGCGPEKDYVLLKLDHLGKGVLDARLPGICELAKKFANVDPVKEPIPVIPTCHYQMGGIPTTFDGQVVTQDASGEDQRVPGLYAAGECACVSVHGANRLGANSLLDIVVFGRSVGIHLADQLRSNSIPFHDVCEQTVSQSLGRFKRWENENNHEDPFVIRNEMKVVMQNHFGVFRDADSMKDGLQKLKKLEQRLQHAKLGDTSMAYNTDRIEMLELDNLMSTAMATAALAEARTESRGAHSRYDFKERDDENWLKHSLYFEGGRQASRPVNFSPKDVDAIPVQERRE